ncbi:MAG: MATE family efflux transporter [Clostridia bacterium]|nr:MATE family efflux transporter [Clostridia bacterium]
MHRNSMNMVQGPLWGKILRFSLTFMLTAVLQQLYNAADVLIVGRYGGQEALAGVGTCSVLVDLFLNFILGLSAGATVVLGQAMGAKNSKGIGKASHTAIAIAIYGGALATAICFLFAEPLLRMIDVPDNVMPQALLYLRIVVIGFIPSLVYNFGAAILRAKGDTKRALYIVSISGIINVLLNLFFVRVCNMRADGVAIATVISQIFTAVLILYVLCHEPDEIRISIRKIRIHKVEFWKIFKIGIPTGIQSSVYSMSNIIVQSSVNSFGSAAIAGAAATSSITKFYNVMISSLYQAALVFSSQNFGAGKFDRIKKTVRICMTYVLALGLIQSVITFFGGKFLVSLYAPGDMEAIEMGVRKFNIIGYAYVFLGLMNVLSGTLRGMGASFLNMVTSVLGVCGIRILWILTVFAAIGTFEALYLCYPISWIGTGFLHFIMFIYVFRKEKRRKETEFCTSSV